MFTSSPKILLTASKQEIQNNFNLIKEKCQKYLEEEIIPNQIYYQNQYENEYNKKNKDTKIIIINLSLDILTILNHPELYKISLYILFEKTFEILTLIDVPFLKYGISMIQYYMEFLSTHYHVYLQNGENIYFEKGFESQNQCIEYISQKTEKYIPIRINSSQNQYFYIQKV